MKQYSWTLMTPGSPPVVGLGDVDEIEHSLSLMTLPGLSSPKALIDHLQKNEDANGAADFLRGSGTIEAWSFAWILSSTKSHRPKLRSDLAVINTRRPHHMGMLEAGEVFGGLAKHDGANPIYFQSPRNIQRVRLFSP
ncbi:hypothetical protein AB4Z25_14830 [Rhizobium sp. RAF36]|jgi:hypothetical protein|uniref:hypothetical protein n=1 Tax=Rhizobium sp. RAF36 TaxID=3233055 RepID=UPI000DDA8F4D